MVAEPPFPAIRAVVVFLIAAVIFIVIYVITAFLLDFLAVFLAGDEDGDSDSVWVHFVFALSGGSLLFYAPQNPVHLEPMIAVMALSVFLSGVLNGGIRIPTGRDVRTWVKKWDMTLLPLSLSYTLGWFSAVVAGSYLALQIGQWQGIVPGTWDVFAAISDPRVGVALMVPCAYLGATQHVYQIPYEKASRKLDDTAIKVPFYRAGAAIYDHLPADTDVSPREIELTIVEHAAVEDTFDAAHRATAEDYLDGDDLESYLRAHDLTQRAGATSIPHAAVPSAEYPGPTATADDGLEDTAESLAHREYDWQHSEVTFADIGGYYPVKQALAEEVIEPVQAATQGDDRFDRFDIEPKRGILFYGPPGTGKTLFARALAGELGVPFVELSPADVTSKWINEGPDRVRKLFAEAAQLAPCVVFLDEAEHLFGGRETSARTAHAEDRKITSEFLVQLAQQPSDVVVVSATNRPSDIDPAILRPGRLATHYAVGLPDEETRHAILETKLDGVPSALTGEELATLAAHTRGFSGADLEDLVDDAKRAAAKRDAEALTRDDFPSVDTLESMAADHERGAPIEVLPDPNEDSSLDDSDAADDAQATDDSDDDDRDHPVGYQ